jgi:hypothetical protein
MLRKNGLQRDGKFAQARRRRPTMPFVPIVDGLRKKAVATPCTRIETGQKLIGKNAIQLIQLLRVDCIARVNRSFHAYYCAPNCLESPAAARICIGENIFANS